MTDNNQYYVFKIWNKLSKTEEVVALIDFANRYVDTFGVSEPKYNIKFEDCDIFQFIDNKWVMFE